ncbi:substrate-binding periplasmic protein [Thalassotalea ganghwensis]
MIKATLFFILISITWLSQAKELVNVYVYHLKPPFVVDLVKQQGLYFDFSRYLNEVAPNYDFHTIFVPRKRITLMLEQGKLDGMLLGVNPVWFKDKEESKYLWSDKILVDRDDFVSLKESPFEYNNPQSLRDKILGGVRGFYYRGINELVEKNELVRVDTVGEDALLHMLLNKRIDTAIISQSAFKYITQDKALRGKFHLSEKPHDQFSRRVLFPKNLQSLYQELLPKINAMYDDSQWQKMVVSYR